MKYLILILMIGSTAHSVASVDCSTKDSYPYITVGVGPFRLVPNLGLGYRQRFCRWGWDAAIGYSSDGYSHSPEGHAVGQLYLNPFDKGSHYLGLGIACNGWFSKYGSTSFSFGPNFVFGKELCNHNDRKQFLELHVFYPNFSTCRGEFNTLYLVKMFVKYGISF